MKLHQGNLYWDKTVEYQEELPKLEKDIETEVLIVGGGISGCLAAYELAVRGFKTTLVEENAIGRGSTLASTGMIQFQSDKMLSEMIEEIGEEKAVFFYRSCLLAVAALDKLAEEMTEDTDYRTRESLYLASTKKDEKRLKAEFETLKCHDFPVEYIEREQLLSDYGINKSAAIRTWTDAEVNPFKFTMALSARIVDLGVACHENTEIDLDSIEDNLAWTKDGRRISFKHLILATGYSREYPFLRSKIRRYRTYSLTSRPVEESNADQPMIWETRRPYLYIRSAGDNRIVAGGLDEERNTLETASLRVLEKTSRIAVEVRRMIPGLNIEPDYYWNAIFYGTADGLPLIGRDPERKNRYYLLGYEGNGICYSMAGARLLADMIEDKTNQLEDIVRPDRK